MDIGIFSFNIEYTRECEARGFESLWLPEHTHIPASVAPRTLETGKIVNR